MTTEAQAAAGDAVQIVAAGEAERIVAALVDSWNVHDAERFAAAFHDDADFTNVFGMSAKGRKEIEAFHAPIFQTMFRNSRLAATETRVRELRPDVATVDIRWEMTGARDPHGDEWPLRRGLISLVITHEAGAWRIAAMHNMDLPEQGLAEAQAEVQRAAR